MPMEPLITSDVRARRLAIRLPGGGAQSKVPFWISISPSRAHFFQTIANLVNFWEATTPCARRGREEYS